AAARELDLATLILAVENGVAKLRPTLADTGFQIPILRFEISKIDVRRIGADIRLRVAAVEEQSGGDMLDIGANLEVLSIAQDRKKREVASGLVRGFRISSGDSDLEPGEFARVANGDIPEVIRAPG